MSEAKFTKDFEQIADSILCGVDYDIYKEDINEMDCELRDNIEFKLCMEFGVIFEMYEFIETYMGGHPEAEEILAKARGEQND
ncbi:hypothetical protein NVP1286O_68 [Vibrio phage 1.286.O._10N.286.55.C4]|nr:hypothetical protein NVP1286O_68 [Vibrio phage 1.286.O._10N.286.55.C4]